MLKRLSDAAYELFSSSENIAKKKDGDIVRAASYTSVKENVSGKLVKSKAQWDVTADDDSDDSMSIALSSGDESELEVFITSGVKYLEQLQKTESDPASKAFILWSTRDFVNIPLRIDDIQYWNDLFGWMKLREGYPFTRRIIQRHPDLTVFMRSKLLNWLFEVTLHFRLQRETLYLAQHYIDSFLAYSNNLRRQEFQLLGLAALLVAAKVEEIRPPTLIDLSQICDESFSPQDIAQFELQLCTIMRWRLTRDTAATWLNWYGRHLSMFMAPRDIEQLLASAFRVLDLSLHSPVSLNYSPSFLAAAALLLFFSSKHSIDTFVLCTGLKPIQLESELLWLREYGEGPERVAYLDPKMLLSDAEFEALLGENVEALAFVHRKMKSEEAEYRKREEHFFM